MESSINKSVSELIDFKTPNDKINYSNFFTNSQLNSLSKSGSRERTNQFSKLSNHLQTIDSKDKILDPRQLYQVKPNKSNNVYQQKVIRLKKDPIAKSSAKLLP